jgi:hypothetical protein
MRPCTIHGEADRPGLRTLAVLSALLGVVVAAGARAPLALAQQDADQVIYRYVDKTGRPVFVNGLSRVPEPFRARARRIDLSRVSLNPELGRELHDEAEREYERLKTHAGQIAGTDDEKERCGDVRGPGVLGWMKRLWAEHGYVVLIAGALLALGIATPFVVRHVAADRWVRVLMVAVPLLAALAVIAYAGVRTSAALRELRGARACPPQTPAVEDLGPLRELRETLHRAKQQRELRQP